MKHWLLKIRPAIRCATHGKADSSFFFYFLQITFVQLFCLLYLYLLFESVTGELSSNPVPVFSNRGVWFPPTEVMHASSASGHGQMF